LRVEGWGLKVEGSGVAWIANEAACPARAPLTPCGRLRLWDQFYHNRFYQLGPDNDISVSRRWLGFGEETCVHYVEELGGWELRLKVEGLWSRAPE
jgi:hypothetical protein